MKPPPQPNYPPIPETLKEVQEIFGDFTFKNGPQAQIVPDPEWVKQNIVFWRNIPGIPWQIQCHRKIEPALTGTFQQLVKENLVSQFRTFEGCFFPRRKMHDPARDLSVHSWGIALDFNADTNQPGTVGDMHPSVIKIFANHGFFWGGNFADPMHFQYVTGY